MPQLDSLAERASEVNDEVRAQVWGLLTALYPRNDLIERRRENRYPFPCFVHLTPVGKDGVTPEGETMVVVGKDISEHGLGFYHQTPLPYRRMIASLESSRGRWHGFLVDLQLVPFHQRRLVRERRPFPASRPLADGGVRRLAPSPRSANSSKREIGGQAPWRRDPSSCRANSCHGASPRFSADPTPSLLSLTSGSNPACTRTPVGHSSRRIRCRPPVR